MGKVLATCSDIWHLAPLPTSRDFRPRVAYIGQSKPLLVVLSAADFPRDRELCDRPGKTRLLVSSVTIFVAFPGGETSVLSSLHFTVTCIVPSCKYFLLFFFVYVFSSSRAFVLILCVSCVCVTSVSPLCFACIS